MEKTKIGKKKQRYATNTDTDLHRIIATIKWIMKRSLIRAKIYKKLPSALILLH